MKSIDLCMIEGCVSWRSRVNGCFCTDHMIALVELFGEAEVVEFTQWYEKAAPPLAPRAEQLVKYRDAMRAASVIDTGAPAGQPLSVQTDLFSGDPAGMP